ncbi:hypothetical protein KP77_21780 [Jeotgalibacillus alimentarius]|uniref:Uncharacterized protein n=1 Tax=Jeotgalibacillus alimentarius TaxID=135826 RepID=A0A0C2VJA6_9BACL|nr:hypothetical protein KP77_21780 [Jeotgalibacillus alimentarius]
MIPPIGLLNEADNGFYRPDQRNHLRLCYKNQLSVFYLF